MSSTEAHSGEPVDDCTAAAVDALQEATRLIAGIALRSLDALGGAVTLPQYRVLSVLADLAAARSARVASVLGLDASTITRLVDRLTASGHVHRTTDPANRSAVTLQLTPAGQHLVRAVTTWRQAELQRLLHSLTPAERSALTTSLTRLIEVAGQGQGASTFHRLPL